MRGYYNKDIKFKLTIDQIEVAVLFLKSPKNILVSLKHTILILTALIQFSLKHTFFPILIRLSQNKIIIIIYTLSSTSMYVQFT